jgi:hypothetical protein
MMRALNIICGISILILSLHMAHAIHHFIGNSTHENYGAVFVCLLIGGIAIDILSFIGGFLLILRRK